MTVGGLEAALADQMNEKESTTVSTSNLLLVHATVRLYHFAQVLFVLYLLSAVLSSLVTPTASRKEWTFPG